jgi:hypothetical protein
LVLKGTPWRARLAAVNNIPLWVQLLPAAAPGRAMVIQFRI